MDENKTEKAAEQAEESRYLFVTVDDVEYGIDISIVQEIIVMQEVSPIPSTKPFCRGVINIRGMIVPVIDLRIKIGMPPCDYDENACIVVVMLGGERIGMIVESVREVIQIPQSQLRESPARTEAGGKRSVSSQIANINGTIKQILDMNKVFDIDQATGEIVS
jgi:purine-binding chemotaxis protein CheW